MKYADKLKDPRWQKKRLRVLEKRGWKCEACKRKDKPLHVHHDSYHGNPWDTPYKELTVLCDSHHRFVHLYNIMAKEVVNIKNSNEYINFKKQFVEALKPVVNANEKDLSITYNFLEDLNILLFKSMGQS